MNLGKSRKTPITTPPFPLFITLKIENEIPRTIGTATFRTPFIILALFRTPFSQINHFSNTASLVKAQLNTYSHIYDTFTPLKPRKEHNLTKILPPGETGLRRRAGRRANPGGPRSPKARYSPQGSIIHGAFKDSEKLILFHNQKEDLFFASYGSTTYGVSRARGWSIMKMAGIEPPVKVTKRTERTEQIVVRVTPAQMKLALRIGKGNASKGVRFALDEFYKDHGDGKPESEKS